jgi:hypothetical protein
MKSNCIGKIPTNPGDVTNAGIISVSSAIRIFVPTWKAFAAINAPFGTTLIVLSSVILNSNS